MNPPGTPAAWPWLAALPFLLSVLHNHPEPAAVFLDDGARFGEIEQDG